MEKYACAKWYIIVALCMPFPINASVHYRVDTIAGVAGDHGLADSLTARSARFFRPSDMAIDGSENIFIVDSGNNAIRKMTVAGAVSTIAGTGEAGHTDARGRLASFSNPFGIALDASGNLYITDSSNYTVRKMVSATGEISTIAGQAGTKGGVDSSAGLPLFRRPFGTVVAHDGTVYVVDSGNHAIRKITTDGTVSTFAGQIGAKGSADGAGLSARFNHPSGITIAPDGNFYVADSQNHTIRMITPTGVVSTIAGQAGILGAVDGIGGIASFYNPFALVVDGSGNLFVTDVNNHTIRKINLASRAVSTIAGKAGVSGHIDGPAALARFNLPWGLAMDSRGNIYVADSSNHAIRKIRFVNNPPAATSEIVTMLQGRTFSKQLVATDADGDKLTFSLHAQATHGTVTILPDGQYTYTPDASYHGPDNFTYKVSDGYDEATATITINVTHVHTPPLAIDGSASGERNKDITGSVPAATDIDGDPLTYKLKTTAARGLVNILPDGRFTYRPIHNFVGVDTFTYEVDDGKGGTAIAKMTITVTHVNTPPIAHNGIIEGKKNIDIIGELPATDADGDSLTYEINTSAANGLVTVAANGRFVYQPVHDFVGTDEFTYKVSDGRGGTATAIVRVKVKDGHCAPIPDSPVARSDESCDDSSGSDSDSSSCASSAHTPPVAQNGIVSGKKNIKIIGNLPPAIEADGDRITYGIRTQAAHGTVHINATGRFTYVPHPNFIGKDSFKYQVSGRGGTAEAIVKVKITEGSRQECHSHHGTHRPSYSSDHTSSDSDDGCS